MLSKLLQAIVDCGTCAIPELIRQTGLNSREIEIALGELERMGYLRRVQNFIPSGEHHCQHCTGCKVPLPKTEGCENCITVAQTPKMIWQLTEKANSMLTRER